MISPRYQALLTDLQVVIVIAIHVALDLGEGATCDGNVMVLRATEHKETTSRVLVSSSSVGFQCNYRHNSRQPKGWGFIFC